MLDILAKAMLGQPDATVVLSGYTDSNGSSGYNEKLSMRRALSVEKCLTDKDITSNRIKVEAYSFTKLVNKCGKDVPRTSGHHTQLGLR